MGGPQRTPLGILRVKTALCSFHCEQSELHYALTYSMEQSPS